MSDFFLYTITILSGLITVITGIVTIIGYFHRKPVSPSQPIIQPTSQHAPPHQVYVPPSQTPLPHIPTAQQPSKQQNHLSHPRIALIALIAQVLLVATAAVAYYVGSKYGSNPYRTIEGTLLSIILIFTILGGLGCAITALVMSLLKTKQLNRWGWFTGLIAGFIGLFIVFLPALIPLLFGIFGPTEQRAAITQAGYPSQPNIPTTSQGTLPSQVSVPLSQPNIQPPLPPIPTAQQPSKQQNHLSHPRIALIALIAQVLLVAAVASLTAVGVKSGQYNLINIISFIAFLGGEACAITALVMSLLKTRQLHRWGWFVGNILGFIGLVIVFLPALIPLLFGIFGPKEQRAANTQAVLP